MFKRIQIQEWQQFENIQLYFDKKVTVITGANGSGKTTILNLLARHFDWNVQSLATPEREKSSKLWRWLTGLLIEKEDTNQIIIGELEYSDGKKTNLKIPKTNSAQYHIQFDNQQRVEGFLIPSHRSIFRYQALGNIPTQSTIDKRNAFSKVSSCIRNRYLGGQEQYSSSFYMKETLVSWSIFGRGNEDMEPNEKLFDYYKGFESILKIVLPKEIGFNKFTIRNFEVVLECDSGNFIIDAASGGLSTIIDMAWQIYMYAADISTNFTVLVDEIENHLHPTMQRRILPDFVKAFPQVNFIVTTHNPLIVGSVEDSGIYVLRLNDDRRIVAQKLDLVNKAKTAAEILDEVLGVSFTMPIWAEDKLSEIVTKYAKEDIADKKTFQDMRSELSAMGLDKLIPDAISGLIIKKDDKN